MIPIEFVFITQGQKRKRGRYSYVCCLLALVVDVDLACRCCTSRRWLSSLVLMRLSETEVITQHYQWPRHRASLLMLAWGKPILSKDGCYCYVVVNHLFLATTWQPHGNHMATTWRPLGNHFATTWRPPLIKRRELYYQKVNIIVLKYVLPT